MDPHHLFPTPDDMAACADLYELTMAAGYVAHRMFQPATFELSVRRMPKDRSYLIFAGLEQALHFLREARFSSETIAWLKKQPAFAKVPREFFGWLKEFRFTGEVWAPPEGSVVFAGEPLLSVRAPLPEAQVVETYLLTTIAFQTAVASKAARVVDAARMHPVIDFGSRRAHGPQAGLLAARACYLAGCAGTSNVLAGQTLGIETFGTQAHSWVMAFPTETEAFRRYAEVFPDSTTLLIDTYDTEAGARVAAQLDLPMRAVRLDSGDLAVLSRKVRGILDRAGREDIRIIASGDLNEYRIKELLDKHCPIDFFGVGTEMVTSRDDPALSGVYKLVEVERDGAMQPAIKLSADKRTLPHLKQVCRLFDKQNGKFRRDVLRLHGEPGPGEPLLQPVMRGGRILGRLPSLADIRHHCLGQIRRLAPKYRDILRQEQYSVTPSAALRRAGQRAAKAITASGMPEATTKDTKSTKKDS